MEQGSRDGGREGSFSINFLCFNTFNPVFILAATEMGSPKLLVTGWVWRWTGLFRCVPRACRSSTGEAVFGNLKLYLSTL
jgi:hypothetical protein